ncbi:MAG TPA: helix-turn-helix transcriptional regulator [Candidatus Saccharimonadales bacterium]|nr:helix-turn-helix transcriptional regulator [Candidatus Saccharimonadales bacterium]
MDNPRAGRTYKQLGRRLRELRSRANETLAEASGAVEIDVRELAAIELGQSRPSEEVLLLLISHFGAKDEDAVTLWEMAGYGMDKIPVAHLSSGEQPNHEPTAKSEKRILFTDVVDVVVNNYGVVMNFMQGGAPNSSPAPVARVGMSREHAKSVLQILQTTLSQTEKNIPRVPKRLITPDNSSSEEQPRN